MVDEGTYTPKILLGIRDLAKRFVCRTAFQEFHGMSKRTSIGSIFRWNAQFGVKINHFDTRIQPTTASDD
jgi:hypothetical protein